MHEPTLDDLRRPAVMVGCRLSPLEVVELDRIAAARGVTRADVLRDAVNLLLAAGAEDRAAGGTGALDGPPAPGQPIPTNEGAEPCPSPVA